MVILTSGEWAKADLHNDDAADDEGSDDGDEGCGVDEDVELQVRILRYVAGCYRRQAAVSRVHAVWRLQTETVTRTIHCVVFN